MEKLLQNVTVRSNNLKIIINLQVMDYCLSYKIDIKIVKMFFLSVKAQL